MMLIVSVGVNAWYTAPAWFQHADWFGVHPIDWVFPVFVTLTGCGLGMAFHRRVPLRQVVQRVLVLTAVGFVYTLWYQWLTLKHLDLTALRWTGVLQFYAALVLVIAVLHVVLRRWWLWLPVSLLGAAVVTWWLHGFAQGCPEGMLTRECNPSKIVDLAVFGQHTVVAAEGHDTVGLVAMAGAMVSVGMGAVAGHIMILRRGWLTVMGLLATAGTAYAAWVITADYVPTMKRLWTAPFAFMIAAPVFAVVALLFTLLDRKPSGRIARGLSWPLIALGRNSLLVYFGSHMLTITLILWPAEKPLVLLDRFVAGLPAIINGSPMTTFVVGCVAAWWALAALLHWRGIYLRP
ncbi:MAG: hypothetical protein V9F04_03165 [Dermatophilaceae bacterium]